MAWRGPCDQRTCWLSLLAGTCNLGQNNGNITGFCVRPLHIFTAEKLFLSIFHLFEMVSWLNEDKTKSKQIGMYYVSETSIIFFNSKKREKKEKLPPFHQQWLCATSSQWIEMTAASRTIPITHWGRVTHICVSKLTIIGSDNGLSPERRQANI